jgi:hypothetical protein
MGNQQNQNPNYGFEQPRKDGDKSQNERAGQPRERVLVARAAIGIAHPIRKVKATRSEIGSPSQASLTTEPRPVGPLFSFMCRAYSRIGKQRNLLKATRFAGKWFRPCRPDSFPPHYLRSHQWQP